MQESTFRTLADAELARIERWLENEYPDLDTEWAADGVLNVETDNGETVIINRHAAAQEIWVAARSGGFHFRQAGEGESWCDTRDGMPLQVRLAVILGATGTAT